MIGAAALSPESTFRAPLASEEALIERGGAMPQWRRMVARLIFSAAHRLNFYRALAVYRAQDIREGAALVSWWNVVTRRGTASSWHPLAVLIPVLLHAMHYRGVRWQSLYKDWVPQEDSMLITASERVGLTPGLLKILIEISLARRQWTKKIRAALLPAAVNLGWLAALLAGVGLYYFPALQRAMPHMRMVGGVADLAHLSHFVLADGPFILLGLLSLPFLVTILLRNLTGALRAALDGLPGFSLYRQATGMTFLLGASALLEVGENFVDAVRLLRPTASAYVRERLDAILAFDDLRPAEAMAATGFAWPDEASIELLMLYMVTRTPQEGIRIIVEDWFEKAGDSYARIGSLINSLGQLLTWGVVGWLYLVTTQLTTTAMR